MKKLLFLFLFLSAFICRGQTPFLNLYGLYSSGVSDSTTAVLKNGSIFYNVQKNAWTAYENGALSRIIKASGNGTIVNFRTIDWGGTLVKDVSMNGLFDINLGLDADYIDRFNVRASGSILLQNISGGNTTLISFSPTDWQVSQTGGGNSNITLAAGTIDFNGSVAYGGNVTIGSWSADQNNLSVPVGRNVRIQSSSAVNVTGIVTLSNTRQIRFNNIGSFPITFPHEDTNSTDINRFKHPNGQDFVLAPGANATVEYESVDSRWIVTSGVIIGSIEAPESSPTQLTFNVTGTTTADVSWLQGGGGFSLFVLSENPIASLPTDDVTYTDNLAFGSGSDLGGSVFVMEITEDNLQGTLVGPLNITGLTAGTPYFGAVFNYTVDGSFVRYNVSLTSENTEGFTTNSSASTPTIAYTVTSVLTKQDSIIVFGTAGNGTTRAVLMAENKEVDSFFVDDQSYSADDFGQGDEIGTGNFVTFNGATTSPLRLAGFQRDRLYSNPYIAELTSLKYLLPPANGPPEFPELLRTAFTYDEKFTSAGTAPGETYLTTSGRLFYDFSNLTGTDGTAISNGNAGLEDLSPSANTATIINTPTVEDITVTGNTVKALGDLSDEGLTTNSDGTGLIDSPFEILFTADFSDGIPSSNTLLYGVLNTSADLIQVVLDATGDLEFYYNSSGASTLRFDTTDPVFADGVTGLALIRYRYDYAANSVSLWINSNPIPLTKISATSVSDHNPTSWSSALDIYVATLNNAGTPTSNPTINYVTSFAVTGLLTVQEAVDVSEYLRFNASSDLEDWVVHETAGFDWAVSNDSLILSGNPAGFEDYLYHNDFFPDSLGEYKIQKWVTIDSLLENGDSGLGLGAINALDTEANRGVIGTFITNPASANFGRVQIYSGSGTVDATAFSFRSQSSGAFIPEKDSSYLFTLERDIQGNDVSYTFTATDLYDSTDLTTSWTELNRTSDQFYGETMRAIIYMNGGPFRIHPFTIRRTGTESGAGGPAPPPPFDADLFVSKTGSDANDCSEALPCLTGNRLMQRIAELSPTVQDAFIGAGTYTENAFWSVPENAGEIRGAGRDLTFIKGSASLYTSTTTTSPSRSSDSRALVQMNSTSTTDVTTKFSSMTFEGNKDVGGTTNSIRHCFVVNERDGVVLEDVAIKFFNTTALKLGNVDDFRMEDFYIRSCSGEASNFTYYQIQTYNIGGGTVEVDTTNYRVIFRDGLIEAEESTFLGDSWSEGGGWGITGGSGNSRYITNTLLEDVEFRINKKGIAQFSGHRFNIEGLYMSLGNVLIKDNIFNNNLSFGGLADLASSLGWTRVTGNTFNLAPDNPTFVIEMQISNCKIDHNFVRGAKNGVFISLNCQDDFGNPDHAAISRGDHGNWDIHNNILELLTNSSGYGMVGGTNWDIKTLHFYNNTIRYTTTSGGAWRVVVVADNEVGCTTSPNLTGLLVQNNLFINPFPSTSTFWGLIQGTITGGISRFNYSTHLVTNQSRTGVTVSNNPSPFGSGNPFDLGLGTPPTTWSEAFTGNYYKPQPGSVLINAGFGSVTIGALEED